MSNSGGISSQLILATVIGLILVAVALVLLLNIFVPAQAEQATEIVKIIGASIVALLILLQSINNGVKADAAKQAATETKQQLDVVAGNVDGNLTRLREELRQATELANYNAGVAAGRKLAQAEAAAVPAAPVPVTVQEPLPVVVVDTTKPT